MTRFATALFGLFFGLVSQAGLAANYTDWWTDASYGGSSMTISQQGNTLGLGWYFYDGQGNPTWIYGFGNLSGTTAGLTLSAARGVTLGDPSSVTPAQIGTATITFTSDSTATFVFAHLGTSAISGRSGQVSLQRWTMAPLPIAGTYRYASKVVQSACTLDSSDNGTYFDFGTRVITVANGNMTIKDTQSDGYTFTFSGPYVQYGSKIVFDGTFTTSFGWSGNGHVDLAFTDGSFQGTGIGQVTTGNPCHLSMSESGVRQ